jgi:sec-independent protein translocase protein TatA
MSRFSIGELLVVAAVVIVFFGYRKLPDLSKNIGRSIRNFRRGLSEPDEGVVAPEEEAKREEPEQEPLYSTKNDRKERRTGSVPRACAAKRHR